MRYYQCNLFYETHYNYIPSGNDVDDIIKTTVIVLDAMHRIQNRNTLQKTRFISDKYV